MMGLTWDKKRSPYLETPCTVRRHLLFPPKYHDDSWSIADKTKDKITECECDLAKILKPFVGEYALI
jgi:hypothetical protein